MNDQPLTDPGRPLWASIELMDRQIVDQDGTPLGKVDDVELVLSDDAPPAATVLLSGSSALGGRVRGVLGRTLEGVSQRLRPDESPVRALPLAMVREIGPQIVLEARDSEEMTPAAELWWRGHVITRLPGGGSATQ